MKKQIIYNIIKIILLAISILAITEMAVYAQEETPISLLKTSEESYIIYIKDTINTDFLFSFSENSQTLEEDLVFSASGLDLSDSNVAYMTKEQASSFKDGKAYMWVKVGEKTTKHEIDLNQAVTDSEIAFVNSTTSRISVNTEENETISQYVDGVKITHTQGKITITEQGEAFSYYREKVSDEKTANFVELAKKIMNSENLTNYERVVLIQEFNNTYNVMLSEINKWEKVPENKSILEPLEETNKGDIYLIWLRDDLTGEHDVQILVCDEEQDIQVEEAKKVTVYETTKLPVTFDSIITLIIVLAIIIVIIAVLVIARKKANQKED